MESPKSIQVDWLCIQGFIAKERHDPKQSVKPERTFARNSAPEVSIQDSYTALWILMSLYLLFAILAVRYSSWILKAGGYFS